MDREAFAKQQRQKYEQRQKEEEKKYKTTYSSDTKPFQKSNNFMKKVNIKLLTYFLNPKNFFKIADNLLLVFFFVLLVLFFLLYVL